MFLIKSIWGKKEKFVLNYLKVLFIGAKIILFL
jgi:hypothetical protein